MVNDGVGSSSVMAAVTCCVPNSAPLLTVVTSTMIVSTSSAIGSFRPVKVMTPLVCPAGMTMLAAEAV
jgi:hypothetical protein